MPTPLELRLIHMARRQAGLEEEHYRLVLKNVAGVESAKQLTQAGLEDVMAVFEDSGFRHQGKPADYWRGKVELRGKFCGERMARRITELAAGQPYALPALCKRVSGGRAEHVSSLRPREASNLIELLKAVIDRHARGEIAAVEALGGPVAPQIDVAAAIPPPLNSASV